MIALSGSRSPGVRLKRLGPWVSLAGVLGCAGIAGWLAMSGSVLELADPEECWENAVAGYFLAVPAFLAAGLTLSCLPEVLHFGTVARKLALAEQRSLGGRRSLAGRIVWALVATAGLGVMLYVLFMRSAGRAWYEDSLEIPVVITTAVAYSVSLFLPAAVASGAAVSLASSRRTGGAHELLMTPHAAEHLGWAVALAHARRGLLWMAAFLPLHAVDIMLFASETEDRVGMPVAVIFLATLLAVLLIEVLAVAAAAALGAWLGAAIPVPALAGMLASPAAVGLWLARLAVIGFAALLGDEMWYNNLAEFLTWFWLALVACWIGSVLVTGLCLRLARGSLALPFAVRLGSWMVRRGGVMAGMSGERPARPKGEPDWAEAGTGAEHSGIWWKLGTAGVWALGAGLLALLGVATGMAGEHHARAYVPTVFWFGWLMACALVAVSVAVSFVVAAAVRRTTAGRIP